MNQYQVNCPSCQQSYQASAEHTGAQMQCTSCHCYFTVPSQEQLSHLVQPTVASVTQAAPSAPIVPKWYKSLTIMGPLCASLLLIGGGVTYWIINNRTVSESQDSYKLDIKKRDVSQPDVQEDPAEGNFAKVQVIKRYGNLYIGISKELMTYPEARSLAELYDAKILDYGIEQPNALAHFPDWLTANFNLEPKAWVRINDKPWNVDDEAILSQANEGAKHLALLVWQEPSAMVINAKITEDTTTQELETTKFMERQNNARDRFMAMGLKFSNSLPAPDADGWVVLFDGKTLYGNPRFYPNGYSYGDGKLALQNNSALIFRVHLPNHLIQTRAQSISARNYTIGWGELPGYNMRVWVNAANSLLGIGKDLNFKWQDILPIQLNTPAPEFPEVGFEIANNIGRVYLNGKQIGEAEILETLDLCMPLVKSLKGTSVFLEIKVKPVSK